MHGTGAGALYQLPFEAPAVSADPDLEDALKQWRKKRASRGRMKPYQVLHNRTLTAIADAKPQTHAALETLPGIGPAKLKRYGDEILEVIDQFV